MRGAPAAARRRSLRGRRRLLGSRSWVRATISGAGSSIKPASTSAAANGTGSAVVRLNHAATQAGSAPATRLPAKPVTGGSAASTANA